MPKSGGRVPLAISILRNEDTLSLLRLLLAIDGFNGIATFNRAGNSRAALKGRPAFFK
jgi:hypothetical protein